METLIFKRTFILFGFLFLLPNITGGTDKDEDNLTFIPTKDWKEIKEGQSIPPGLHVRLNLQTGKKEAKLLEEDENNKKPHSALSVTDAATNDETQEGPELSRKRLEEALKNIPNEGRDYTEEQLKKITKQFKSYEEIKETLKDINMNVKTDFEIISDLFGKYEKLISAKDISNEELNVIFEDLNYLVHQVDNAVEFVSSGGLEKIIIPNLNQSNLDVKLNTIKLLGTIMQNNPQTQISAFEKNLGFLLLQLLSRSNDTKEMSSLLFALGSLLRKFPFAQKELLNKPGLKIMVDLLGKQIDYKIKIKCLLLITDLINDYNEVTNVPWNGDVEKIKQYNAADIKGRLSETDYCKAMDELFNLYRRDFLDNLYTAEDILNVLMTSKDICQPVWAESPIFRHTLLVIKNNYDGMKRKVQENDTDLDNVTSSLEQLNEFLYSHIVIKDEL